MGIGTTREYFQSVGSTPMEMEELKMRESRMDREKAIYLSFVVETKSEPADLLEDIHERRLEVLSGQSRSHGKERKEERVNCPREGHKSY